MTRLDQIDDALAQLDPDNDDHWTSSGKPRLDVVRELSGVADASRKEVEEVARDLTRETADAPPDDEPQAVAEAPEEAEVAPDDIEAAKADCRAKIDAVQEEINAATKERDDAIRKISALERKHTMLGYLYEKMFPKVQAAEAVKRYQEASRAHVRRSRLSEAMKDKRGFGRARPDGFLLGKT